MSCSSDYLNISVTIVWHNEGNQWTEIVGVDAAGRPDDGMLKWNPELGWPGTFFCDRCFHDFDSWWQVEEHWQPQPHEDCNDLLLGDVCSDCGLPVIPQ